jgi:hypothetical protein
MNEGIPNNTPEKSTKVASRFTDMQLAKGCNAGLGSPIDLTNRAKLERIKSFGRHCTHLRDVGTPSKLGVSYIVT